MAKLLIERNFSSICHFHGVELTVNIACKGSECKYMIWFASLYSYRQYLVYLFAKGTLQGISSSFDDTLSR